MRTARRMSPSCSTSPSGVNPVRGLTRTTSMRAALEVDPNYLGAHLTLARTLAERGDREMARSEAERALALANRKADARAAEDAKALLARLAD